MSDNEVVGSVILVGASLFGLVTGIITIVKAKARNDLEHQMVLKKLEDILKHNAEILDNLDDVLKHPQDTVFSVEELTEELHRELREIKHLIRELK